LDEEDVKWNDEVFTKLMLMLLLLIIIIIILKLKRGLPGASDTEIRHITNIYITK
jgi:hypothetical protein